ncbi:MAG: hypothetical protein HQL66_09195 [Magnetococcales bacterium]|nr:hypothetical protein [Magnetococcales bacterium]
MTNKASEHPQDPWSTMGRVAALRTAFPQGFTVLTFPPLGMFQQQADSLETIERWYRCLADAIATFTTTGTPFYDPKRVVHFPSEMPFSNFLAPDPCVALSEQHHTLCSQVRRGVSLAEADRRPESQQALREATGILQNLITTLHDLAGKQRGRKIPATSSPIHVGDLLAQHIRNHRLWVDRYQEHLTRILEYGVVDWEYVREAGDFVNCALGHALIRHDGILQPIRHREEFHKLNDLHKHFHATLAVDIEVASALRFRGLTPGEFDHLRRMVVARRGAVRQLSRELIDQMAAAFDRLLHHPGDPVATQSTELLPLPTLTQTHLAENILGWQNRILGFVNRPFDIGIDGLLLHTTCPTGKRIHTAIGDPMRFKAYEQPLLAMERLHMQAHATATIVVALVRAGQTIEARTMTATLEQDVARLIAFIRKTGEIIGVVDA